MKINQAQRKYSLVPVNNQSGEQFMKQPKTSFQILHEAMLEEQRKKGRCISFTAFYRCLAMTPGANFSSGQYQSPNDVLKEMKKMELVRIHKKSIKVLEP
jgi:histidinol phosphatase-like enzyme